MSAHAATPTLTATLRVLTRRTRPARHRATSRSAGRLVSARHRATRRPTPRHARALLSTLPILLAGLLTVLALATPQQAATAALRTDVVQPAVRLQVVAPEVLPAAPAPVVEEDDPRFDCRVDGNRSCPEVRYDARFPGVAFHYVVTYAADGTPERSYTARQWATAQGLALPISTATDRY